MTIRTSPEVTAARRLRRQPWETPRVTSASLRDADNEAQPNDDQLPAPQS